MSTKKEKKQNHKTVQDKDKQRTFQGRPVFELEQFGEKHNVFLNIHTYMMNPSKLYVMLLELEEDFPQPWSVLTVNLNMDCPENCAFIDTNNNGEKIIAWLVQNNIAVPTGRLCRSGYCIYPECRFDPKVLKMCDPDGYANYQYLWKTA